jgi:archaellum component FlaC
MTKTLEERITEIENRIDDFNIRNEAFYSGIKDYIKFLEQRIEKLESIIRKHFWMGD